MSPAPNLPTRRVIPDRRQHQRFPIAVHAEYILQGRRGEVVTINISSSAILIQSTETLPAGRRVELKVDWPARLDGRCPLRLVITGKVVGRTSRGTVISVLRHEYRLAAKASLDLAKTG